MCVLPSKDSVSRRGVAVERNSLSAIHILHPAATYAKNIISVNVAEFIKEVIFL